MKRRMTLSLVLVLSVVLLSLMSSDSTATAQPKRLFVWNTGIVTLGPTQILRLTVNTGSGNDSINVRFRRIEYTSGICNGGVCNHAIASQNTSAQMTLMPSEGASFDIPNTAFGLRGVVLTNERNATVTAQIINTMTGNVDVAFLCPNSDQEQFN